MRGARGYVLGSREYGPIESDAVVRDEHGRRYLVNFNTSVRFHLAFVRPSAGPAHFLLLERAAGTSRLDDPSRDYVQELRDTMERLKKSSREIEAAVNRLRPPRTGRLPATAEAVAVAEEES
jgi:hypothetical protein